MGRVNFALSTSAVEIQGDEDLCKTTGGKLWEPFAGFQINMIFT